MPTSSVFKISETTDPVENAAVMFHNLLARPLDFGAYSSTHNDLDHFTLLCSTLKWGTLEDFLDGGNYLLTFDDGYKSVITHGLPILEQHEIPAIVFITTGFISGEIYPYELYLTNLVITLDVLKKPSNSVVELSSPDVKANVYRELREEVRRKSSRKQIEHLKKLADLNEFEWRPTVEDGFLSWEDVKKLSRHPLVTIGAHTLKHQNLLALNPVRAFQEMRQSRKILESRLSCSIDTFAYPYGYHNAFIRYLARRAGFRYAFTTEFPGTTQRKYDNLRIPRIDAKSIRIHQQ